MDDLVSAAQAIVNAFNDAEKVRGKPYPLEFTDPISKRPMRNCMMIEISKLTALRNAVSKVAHEGA